MREKFIQQAKEGDILIRTSLLVDKEEEKIIYVSLLKIYKLVDNYFTDESDEKLYIHELIHFFNKKDKWEMDTRHSVPSLTITGSQVIKLDWEESLLPDLNAEEHDFCEFSMSDNSGEIWEKMKIDIDKHEPFEKVMETVDKNGFYKICIDYLG